MNEPSDALTGSRFAVHYASNIYWYAILFAIQLCKFNLAFQMRLCVLRLALGPSEEAGRATKDTSEWSKRNATTNSVGQVNFRN